MEAVPTVIAITAIAQHWRQVPTSNSFMTGLLVIHAQGTSLGVRAVDGALGARKSFNTRQIYCPHRGLRTQCSDRDFVNVDRGGPLGQVAGAVVRAPEDDGGLEPLPKLMTLTEDMKRLKSSIPRAPMARISSRGKRLDAGGNILQRLPSAFWR